VPQGPVGELRKADIGSRRPDSRPARSWPATGWTGLRTRRGNGRRDRCRATARRQMGC